MSEKELRELDAFIAEHVMGWAKHHAWVSGIKHWEHCWHSLDTSKATHNFRPTTDPAAAMMVLERCLTKVAFGLCVQDSAGGYCVSLNVDANGYKTTTAPTLPLAICLFAKKLFGGAK